MSPAPVWLFRIAGYDEVETLYGNCQNFNTYAVLTDFITQTFCYFPTAAAQQAGNCEHSRLETVSTAGLHITVYEIKSGINY